MAGLNLIGVGAFVDALDDFTDAHTPSGSGVRIVGSNAEYASHQEFGTSRQAGTPHLRPAAHATQAQMAKLAVQADSLDDLLDRAALHLHGGVRHRAPVDTGYLRSSYSVTNPDS